MHPLLVSSGLKNGDAIDKQTCYLEERKRNRLEQSKLSAVVDILLRLVVTAHKILVNLGVMGIVYGITQKASASTSLC